MSLVNKTRQSGRRLLMKRRKESGKRRRKNGQSGKRLKRQSRMRRHGSGIINRRLFGRGGGS